MILSVKTFCLRTGKVRTDRRIVFDNEGKAWLQKNMYWAMLNQHGVQISNILDKELVEKL